MGGLFMGGGGMRRGGSSFTGDSAVRQRAARAEQGAMAAAGEVKALQGEVQRLCLLNQALWEILREKLGISDTELEQKAVEVDLRDGVADGKMTDHAVRCPNCNRVNNSKHGKCLYCGQTFAKDMFG